VNGDRSPIPAREAAPAGVEASPPPGAPSDPRLVRGRLAAVSVRDAARAGAWIGLALGLAIGAAVGIIVAWLAGAVLDWEAELSATYGIAGNLLPLGGHAGGPLRTLSDLWWVVIPVAAIACGALTSILGALAASLVAVGFNARRPEGLFEGADDAGAGPGSRGGGPGSPGAGPGSRGGD
jgi:hypothetical protein